MGAAGQVRRFIDNTGGGTNIGAFDPEDGNQGNIEMKLVYKPLGGNNADVEMNKRQRKVINLLLDAGPGGFEGSLTARKYRGRTKASPATAKRDIADLLKRKIIKQNSGAGRSVSYDLLWPE